MEIIVRDDEKDPELRVRWYEGTSTFHVDVRTEHTWAGVVYEWQEVAVQTHYADDQGNPPSAPEAFNHARRLLNEGVARELADAELRAR